MARKDKSAALYELVYKDKGKATAPDGSLKLPGWFRGRGQPAQAAAPPVSPPVAPPPSSLPPVAASPSSSPPVAGDRGATPPSPAMAGETKQASFLGTAGETSPPAAPAPSVSPPVAGDRRTTPPSPATTGDIKKTPFRATAGQIAARPPWAPAPLLRLADGRVRIDISTFAAVVALGGLVCLLLGSYILGAYARGGPAAQRGGQHGDGNPPVDPSIVGSPATPESGRQEGQASGPAAGGNVADPNAYVRGRSYVIVHSFGANKLAAEKALAYLTGKGYAGLVLRLDHSKGIYVIRSGQGTDRASAQLLANGLGSALEALAREQPGLIKYEAADPNVQPYVVTAR